MGAPINTEGNETTGMLSYDGTKMLMFKDVDGKYDVLKSELKGAKWSMPTNFSSEVNSSDNQTFSSYSYNERKIFFITDRKRGDANYGTDIYECGRSNAGKWSGSQTPLCNRS